MKPFAFATVMGAICIVAIYNLPRGVMTPYPLAVIAIISAVAGALVGVVAPLLNSANSKPRIGPLALAFAIGVLLSEAIRFAHYSYFVQDIFIIGLGLSVITSGFICTIGGITMLVVALLKSRITRRSSGTPQKRGAP